MSPPLLRAAKPAAVRRLAIISAIACGLLAVAAPAALANHVSSVVANGCSSVTYNFVNFKPGTNTITMTILEANGTTVDNTGTGSFTGTSGSTTLPIKDGTNGEVIIPQATWNTNGSHGSYNTKKPYKTITLHCTAPPPSLHYTGDAYNLSAAGLINIANVNEVGPVDTKKAENLSKTVLDLSIPLVTLDSETLTSTVTTGSNTSTASTDTEGLSLGAQLGLPAIAAAVVTSTSTTACNAGVDRFSGSTTVVGLSIGGVPVSLPTGPITAPITIPLPAGLGFITVDENVPVIKGGKQVGLTINALHIHLALLGTVVQDVVIGHASSDIEGCA